MLRNISNLGIVLNKSTQKSIKGGVIEIVDCSSKPTFNGEFCYICGVQYLAHQC